MKIKRLLLAGILGIVCWLNGCGKMEVSNGSGSENSFCPYEEPQYDWDNTGGVTLTLWSQEPEMERIYMQRAIHNYEKDTGNHIEVVALAQDEFQGCVAEALHTKADAPDLLLSYGGTNIDAFNPDENFYDFTDAVWVDDLTDTSINQAIYNGKIIGLPHWEASISGTLYNKEIFSKHHIAIPQNIDDFLAVCETLLAKGITPVYLPFQSISMMLYQFPLDTIVKDTDILNALNDGTMGYDDMPEMKLVLEWYKTMAERGYFGENFTEDTWDGMNDAMKSGEYAMMLCWDTWLYTDFEGDSSSFGLMPAFIGVPENGTFEGPNLGLLIVNKKSDKLNAALNFITYLADPYTYNRNFEGIYTAPVFKHQVASISTPQYMEAERLIDRNYHDSTAWLRIKGFSQMDAKCIIDYIMSKDGTTAEQCLEAMEQLRRERMDKNQYQR